MLLTLFVAIVTLSLAIILIGSGIMVFVREITTCNPDDISGHNIGVSLAFVTFGSMFAVLAALAIADMIVSRL